MRIDSVRIQNFQCIRDSGDICLDEHMTVLVGENESGKSAILKALEYFNQGAFFKDVDVSTMSFVRPRIDSAELARDGVEIVAVNLTLSDKERKGQSIPEELADVSKLRVVKTLANTYKVLDANGEDLSKARVGIRTGKLVGYLEDLKKKVQNVYCGRVKRKEYFDKFVFLERQRGEPNHDNLILHTENAPGIWDELNADDWVQVTKIGENPYGGNRRPLNVGLKFDLESPLDTFINTVKSSVPSTQAFESFKASLNDLPPSHPLRDYLGDDVFREIEALCQPAAPSDDLSGLVYRILNKMPVFVYLPDVANICDSISISDLQIAKPGEGQALVRTILRIAGLRPDLTAKKDSAERMQILKEKSRILSEQLRRHWFKKDITVDFDYFNEDREIGIAIESDGSFDPPSRRSKGFISYLSLFAKLADLATKENIVLLLDDPAMSLHPMAQKHLRQLLESQQYQIVLATHLPFLIDPEHLERIRVVRRTSAGSQVEQDWAKVEQSLLPVWGALVGNFTGRVWLLVEGKRDMICYSAASKACQQAGRQHLSSEVVIVPSGGDQLPFVAQALHARGIFFIALLDGDKAGQENSQRVLNLCAGLRQERSMSLSQLGLSMTNPEIEHLFSGVFRTSHSVKTSGLEQAVREAAETGKFDEETITTFERVFERVNVAIAKCSEVRG
jgi:hypothetical protein